MKAKEEDYEIMLFGMPAPDEYPTKKKTTKVQEKKKDLNKL